MPKDQLSDAALLKLLDSQDDVSWLTPEEKTRMVRLAGPAPAASHETPAPRSSNPLVAEISDMNASHPLLKRLADSAEMGGVSSGAPTAVGQAVQQFAPGLSNALKGGAEKLYGSLAKVKDATIQKFPTVIQDLLAARVPISQGGRAKVIGNLKRIGKEKGQLLEAADERAMVPRSTLRRGLDTELETALSSSEAPVKDMTKLAKVERDLLPDEMGVTPSKADRIKTKLQREADRGFTAAKMGGKVTDTTARAKMAVSDEAKQALEAIEPKLKDVNASYAKGKGMAQALRDTLKRTDKNNLVSLSDLMAGAGGAAVGGPGGGAAGIALMKLLNHPSTGSRIAIGANEMARIPHLDQAAKAALLSLLQQDQP